MKTKKQALAKSVLALLLCVAMLVGTTFAWFTDSVVSGMNTITAGNLDVELYHSNAAVRDKKVTANTKLFLDMNGDDILWEPGVVSYENLTVVNEGDLALVYQMVINTANENFIVDGNNRYGLSQVLKVGFVEGGITATDRIGVVKSVDSWTTLSSFLTGGSLLPQGTETVGIVIYWQPGDNDNNWNLNNGKTLNEGTALNIDLGINLIATQEQHEYDSFGNDYDVIAADEVFPEFNGGNGGVSVNVGADNRTTEEVSLTAGDVTVTVPAGVLVNPGVNKLSLSVTSVTDSEANIKLDDDEAVRSLDVHVDGVANNNDKPLTVTMPEAAPVALNLGNHSLYHVENGNTNAMTLVNQGDAFTGHNQYKYDPATGDVVLYMATFSEVAMVANTQNAWEGNFDYSWYIDKSSPYSIANADQLAAFGAIVGNMKKVTGFSNGQYSYDEAALQQNSFENETVNLVNDIYIGDLTDEDGRNVVFYPVGYWNSERTYDKTTNAISSGFYEFMGTFDGQGHTVSDFYQNTWEMKGDHNWYAPSEQRYRDGMGLFGKVYKGTVKNLTVKNFSSDGEITTTGCIAAYADGATFENIAIVNCNPRVYNIGNGGIVGCVGWYAEEAGLTTTFKNITVDNSNKISALWGSYDVACGGIVGQYYPTSGQTDANTPKNGGIDLENCHISAQMDVYNDVCGNYQYYAYRYAGILIGSVRENVTGEDGHVYPDLTGIEATDCTVHFGTWNDYFYCEFEKNGHPSYSGPDDYKFSRVPDSELLFTDTNENGIIDTQAELDSVKGCKHTHTAAEDNQAVYLEFNNLITGYGWGVTSKGVGDMPGVEILDRIEADSVQKWNGKVNNLLTDTTYNLSHLFDAINGEVEIINSSTVVTITNKDAINPVEYVINTDSNDWANTTIKFLNAGSVYVTIQDYYFCQPTTIEVKVDALPTIYGNLVANGNFEADTNGWSTSSAIVRDISTSTTGLASLKLDCTTVDYAWTYVKINVEKNTDYVLNFKAKTSDAGLMVNFQSNWTDISAQIPRYTMGSSSSWKDNTYKFNSGNYTSIMIYFQSGWAKSSNSYIWVDDVAVTEYESVINSSFENGSYGWTLSDYATVVSGDAHTGNSALQVTMPSKQYYDAAVQYIDVEPNTAYEITYWSKRVSGNGTFNVYVIDGQNYSGTNWMNETSGNWVKNTIILMPNKGVSKIGIKISNESTSKAGTILLDDFSVSKTYYTADNFIVDGNFESGSAIKWTNLNGSVTNEDAHTGNYSLKMNSKASAWGKIGSISFATTKDKTYTITMYIKVNSNGTKGGANTEVRNGSDTKETVTLVEGNKYPNGQNNAEWMVRTISFTATSKTSTLHFTSNGEADTAAIYVDDIVITEG